MGGSRDKPFTLRVESDLYLPQGTGSAVCCAEGLLDSAHYRREIHRSGPPMRKRDVKRFPVKNRVLPTGTRKMRNLRKLQSGAIAFLRRQAPFSPRPSF